MKPGTNRMLMLLVSVAIAGCANQTERSSSGGSQQAQSAVAAEPAKKESVTRQDTPVETPAARAAAPAPAPKDESTPEFPVTKYEIPADQAVQEEQANEEVEDLGPQEDESASAEQAPAAEAESSVGETTMYDDDKSDAEDDKEAEVDDLGPLADESGTVTYPEESRPAADKTVGEPTIFPDEPVAQAQPAPPPKPEPRPAKAEPKPVSVNFETEPLFGFDKSQVRADQKSKLDEFVAGLAGVRYESIEVVGYADRIGTEAYNQGLSERRAEAVKGYLASKGVPAGKIKSEGRGKSSPTTGDACAKTRGKALISCLQPDRRVEVSVNGTKQ